jgi:hypothetical protein
MSTASSMVSFRGEEEVDLNEALDTLFRELQENLNNSHCSIRNLGMSEDRNDSFMEMAKYHHEIEDYANDLVKLFSELKSISKQILGKPVNEDDKIAYKKLLDQRKLEKQLNKMKV